MISITIPIIKVKHTSADSRKHCNRIPYRIRAEQRHRIARLQSIIYNQRSRDVGRQILKVVVPDLLFCDCIYKRAEIFRLVRPQRRVLRVEEPLPDGDVGRDWWCALARHSNNSCLGIGESTVDARSVGGENHLFEAVSQTVSM